MTVTVEVSPDELIALGTDVSSGNLRSEDFIRRLILACQSKSVKLSEELQLFNQIFDEWSEPDDIESNADLFFNPSSDEQG